MKEREDLLRYYHDELAYLRRAGREFSRLYPKVAARLEISAQGSADPHVERLIESFAFLTARLQRRMDLEFPEISGGLLSVLYPHLVQPIPPLAIARFHPDAAAGKLTTGHTIDRQTRLFARTRDGLTCRFRTCYPVELWPVEVTEAQLLPRGDFAFLNQDSSGFSAGVSSVLRIRLTAHGNLAELPLNRLRFFINSSSWASSALSDLLFSSLSGIALTGDADDFRKVTYLPPSALSQAGFGPDDELTPTPGQSHPGYRLLQEYLHFPAKFRFFDVDQLSRRPSANSTMEIMFLLRRSPAARLDVDRETFALGCTPIVNLFPRTSEPIRIDQRKTEYRLVADHRREQTTEIHSIQSVSASSDPARAATVVEPYFSFRYGSESPDRNCFWHTRRIPVERADMAGTDLWLSFLDLSFRPSQPASQVVYAHTLCTNRELAVQFAPGSELQMEDAAPVKGIMALTRPTQTSYPAFGGPELWQLVSSLSLNHLSLGGSEQGAEGLRQLLRLFISHEDSAVRRQIEGLVKVRTSPATAHLGGQAAWRGFCEGTEVELTFDESLFVGSSPVLLASVLRHFLALYSGVNSFTQVVMKSLQRGDEEIRRWPPLAGWQPVI